MSLFQPSSHPLNQPSYHYARLVPPKPLTERVIQPVLQGPGLLSQSVRRHTANDYQLAQLNDSLRLGGGALLATLATLAATSPIIGVGEFLGFATWFAAMGITPKILSALVRLRTGVNLDQEYLNSQGERNPLFKDPKYLPLHMLSDEEIERVARRLKLPPTKTRIQRREQVEETMRRISVQARTWWMLVAGPATPVISGLICDRLEQPVKIAIQQIRQLWLDRAVTEAARKNPSRLVESLNRAIETAIGEVPNAKLTLWWQSFGARATHALGLDKDLKPGEVLGRQSDAVLDRITDYLSKLSNSAEERQALRERLSHFAHEDVVLEGLKHRVEDQLTAVAPLLNGHHPGLHHPGLIAEKRAFLNQRIQNAQSTVAHYHRLIERILEGPVSSAELKQMLTLSNVGELQRMVQEGQWLSARRAIGSKALADKVLTSMRAGRFAEASALLGDGPGHHLLISLKQQMLRRRWRFRMLGVVGGGLLLATTIYTQWFMGRVPKPSNTPWKPATQHTGGGPKS